MYSRTSLLYFLLIFLFSITTTKAGLLPRQDPAPPEPQVSPAEAGADLPGCQYEGNPDIYGIGIRVGVYTQWLSTLLTNWLLINRNSSHIRDINTCFQFAMLIALLSLNNGPAPPHSIDAYLIILQIVGSTSTISSHATNKKEWKSTSWGGLARFGIYWAVSAYSTYYFFYGSQHDADFAPMKEGCMHYGFLFAKIPLEKPWFRYLHCAISATALTIFTILFGFLMYKHGRQFLDQSIVAHYRAKKSAPEKEGLLDDLTDGEMSPAVHKVAPAFCTGILVVAVVAIEATVLFNEIQGVNDPLNTGQLIPLVTGVGGLVRTVYKLWRHSEERVHLLHKEKRVGQSQRPQGRVRAQETVYRGAQQSVPAPYAGTSYTSSAAGSAYGPGRSPASGY